MPRLLTRPRRLYRTLTCRLPRIFAALLAGLVCAAPAAAHDLPRLKTPGSTVVVQQTEWPDLGRRAGEGRVRLVYHSANLAMRMGVDEFHAFERAYTRRLTSLMQRMSFEAADPIARHGAWHDIAGRSPAPAFTTGGRSQ